MEFLKYIPKCMQYNKTPHTHHSASFIYQHFVKGIFFNFPYCFSFEIKKQTPEIIIILPIKTSVWKNTFLLIPSIQ